MTLTRGDIIDEDCRRVTSGQVSRLDPLKNERLLITGGTGFMGTWLAEMIAFLNDNFDFNIHVTLLSSRASSLQKRVPHIASRHDVTLIERDIRNLTDIPTDISWIVHAAANPDSRFHASYPLRTIEIIVNGTNALLEYASRLPELKKVLNISSGHVYGTQSWNVAAIPENFLGGLDCSALNSAYPESKRLAETICAVYRNQQRLPILNARPFAFIGPYQLLDRPWAINNFIRDSLLGGPIRILGDGQTVRSYMYSSDMAWWLLIMLVHGTVGMNYNVGSPEAVTLQTLAEKIAGQFPKPPRIVKGLSQDKLLRRTKFVPSVDLAEKSLGLRITVDLDTALKRTIAWNQSAEKTI
jgi:dTDP-glucose 4,6-dehydratase